tara:strand:+ start:553 stop:1671 length:1119 start_codon:yes stop_codon:yes gene_type:complete
MSEAAHNRIRRLFDQASQLPAELGQKFLIRECGADANLLQRLRAIIAAAADKRFLATTDSNRFPKNQNETMTNTILITGCSSGFGRLAAERFARQGNRVYATMRGVDGKNAAVSGELLAIAKDEGLDLRVLELDVCSTTSVNAAAARVLEESGAPDVVINNAGQMFVGVTEAFDDEELARQLDINMVGVHRVHRAFLPAMRAKGSGLSISVSSVAGRLAIPFFGVYHASKWALEGYSQALRTELASSGVDVVLVEPGPFTTALFPTSPKPADADGRAATYPAVVPETFEALGKSFEQLFESDDGSTDPMHVVDRFAELVAMAPGSRPFRSVVGVNFGVEELNKLCEPQEAAVLAAMELTDFATLSTTSSKPQ